MAPATLPAPPGWPDAPPSRAWSGLAGEIAGAVAPHTEADPLAVLAQLLVGAGAVIGRGAHFAIEATRHHPGEYCVLVGESAKARKGSSWDHVAAILAAADPGFAGLVHSGLSTGEGLIFAARDRPGGTQRRLLVVEPEFVSVLKAAARDQATLSPVLRAAWDGRPLAVLTRSAPLAATTAHICVIGHITRAELAANLSAVEAANGFLNRFVFIACRRQRLLPEGGDPDPLAGSGLVESLAANLAAARHAGPLRFGEQARTAWADIYTALAARTDDGLLGPLLARAEAHVLRLSMLYALTDGARLIGTRHLEAGLALFDYAAASLAWATARTSTDPLAERIANALAEHHDGLTRTQLRDLFGRNVPSARIDQALAVLLQARRARPTRASTAGRPAQIWSATQA